ncbi:MarR family winged helix-turn-helix transcriptional regulator [Ornithinimicrobium sp. LYQ121]|uniref:MarR family winged helix-turn-helix transcriptional regulator n=1 Tax=Ornithinimicrobium sp. LYQ121 TaxID=3378801 RepID=UPI0038518613
MIGGRDDSLLRLDAALLTLRRLTSAPTARPVLDHDGSQVEVSTMLVVDAVARCAQERACSIQDVAQALTVAHSTASRLVDRAVRAGVLTRDRDAEQRRRTVLRLTGTGRQLQTRATSFRTGLLAAVTASWSTTDVAALTELVERFADDARPHLSTTERNP